MDNSEKKEWTGNKKEGKRKESKVKVKEFEESKEVSLLK